MVYVQMLESVKPVFSQKNFKAGKQNRSKNRRGDVLACKYKEGDVMACKYKEGDVLACKYKEGGCDVM